MTLWNRFTAWLSGWPVSTAQGKKLKKDEELFAEEQLKSKPKGLNPKKKKTSKKKSPKKSKGKGIKQGNMT